MPLDDNLFGHLIPSGGAQQQQPAADGGATPDQGGGVTLGSFVAAPTPLAERKHQYTPEQVKAKGLDPKFAWGYNEASPEYPIKIGEAAKGADVDLTNARNKLGAVIVAAKKLKWLSQHDQFATGWGRKVGIHTPTGPTVDGLLRVINSNEAFTELEDLLKNSPTGANPLSRTTENEVKLLAASHYSLDPGQHSSEFERQMDEVIKNYSPMFDTVGGDKNDLYAGADYGDAPPDPTKRQEMEAAGAKGGALAGQIAGEQQQQQQPPPPPPGYPGADQQPPDANRPAASDIDFSGQAAKRPAGAVEFQSQMQDALNSGQIKDEAGIRSWMQQYNAANGTNFSVHDEYLKAAGKALEKGQIPTVSTPSFEITQQEKEANKADVEAGGATGAGIVGVGQAIPGSNKITAFVESLGQPGGF